jgi:hypothetical protein
MSAERYWLRESRICAEDRMYGCAAFALSRYIEEYPDKETAEHRAQIEEWRTLGDVAVNDSHAERVARQLDEGRRLQERRFAALAAKAAKGTLDAAGKERLRELAVLLDTPDA